MGLLLPHGNGESLARSLQEPGYQEYKQGEAVHPDGLDLNNQDGQRLS